MDPRPPSVLITGTSSGIGCAAAAELAARGWRVLATMRDVARRAALDAAVAGAPGPVTVASLDVTDATALPQALRGALAPAGGELDAVVHNAGVAVGGAFEDLPEAELRRVMETNFFGVLSLTRLLLPLFRAQRRGRIVIVSSNSAFFGEPANSIYVASKWAIEGWAESLAYEVAPFGVDVVLIEPGPYRTEIWNTSPRILPADSAYRALLEPVERAIDQHVVAAARDPREVGRAIADALAARRPPFRIPVSPQARVDHFLRGKMPSRWRRALVTRLLGLHRLRL